MLVILTAGYVRSELQFDYLFTFKNALWSSNSYTFWIKLSIVIKRAKYMAVILLCTHCKFEEKYYNSGDNFFLWDCFYWRTLNQSIKTHLYSTICRERIRGAYIHLQSSSSPVRPVVNFITLFSETMLELNCKKNTVGGFLKRNDTPFSAPLISNSYSASFLFPPVLCHGNELKRSNVLYSWTGNCQ